MDSEYEQNYDEDFSGWPEVEGWESQPVDDYDPTYGWMDEGDVYDHCPDITCREDILADSRFRHLWAELEETSRVWMFKTKNYTSDDEEWVRDVLDDFGDDVKYWCLVVEGTECGSSILRVLVFFHAETSMTNPWTPMECYCFEDVKEEVAFMKMKGGAMESGTLYLSKSRKRVFDDMN